MDVFGVALSGMQAAQTQLLVGADNIANLNTPGFKSSRVDLAEGPGGGVQVADIQKDNTPGPLGPDGEEGSNVDVASEMVGLSQARTLYTANAMVVRTADQMTGTLLDIMDSHRHANQ
jgi:flagellar basal-body rod protein FlgC